MVLEANMDFKMSRIAVYCGDYTEENRPTKQFFRQSQI